MNKEEVNKFCKEYYGFTLENADESIGYWMSKYQELEHNWNELKKWLEEELGSKYIHKYDVLDKMQELERGEE